MSKTLHKPRLLCAVLFVAFTALPLFAQSKKPQATGRVRLKRPRPQTLQVPSPQLKQVLVDWYKNTSKITHLAGQHTKFVYDKTFNVEKRGIGKFYYEAPDKGRIDIQPAEIPKGAVSRRVDPRTKKPFELIAAPTEIWLSDGKTILAVDESSKRARRFAIPPKAQGRNIMDGPLPFLLGMPPNKALARYKLKILKNTETEVWLHVWPRWRTDAANFREAKVILQKEHYLPSAVLLQSSTGNEETVYTFSDFNLKPRGLIKTWFVGDWKKFDLRGYKVENQNAQRQAAKRAKVPTMPNLRGVEFDKAKKLLAGKKMSVVVSSAAFARRKEHFNRIVTQLPAAGSPIAEGQKVFVSILVNPANYKQDDLKTIPKLRGLHYKAAQAELEKIGYQVELRKGNVAKNPADVYKVEFQYPPAGQPALKRSKIALWLYVNKDDRKRQAKRANGKSSR